MKPFLVVDNKLSMLIPTRCPIQVLELMTSLATVYQKQQRRPKLCILITRVEIVNQGIEPDHETLSYYTIPAKGMYLVLHTSLLI